MSLDAENTARNFAAMEKWNVLAKARMKSLKITQERLAERLGVTQGAVAHWFSGRREPDLATINAILDALGLPKLTMGDQLPVASIEDGPPISSPFRAIRIVGTAQLGPDGYWHELDSPEGIIDVPSRDPGAYALRLKGDSMAPAIRNGWVALCEPNHQLIPGEYVMVRLQSGESMVKELLYQNESEVSLMSLNSTYGRRTIPRDEIDQIHYVGGIFPPGKIRI